MFAEELQARQNSTVNIERLAAQRRLYSEAKIINNCNFIVTVFIPILISILPTMPNLSFLRIQIVTLIFHVYTLIAIVLQYRLTTNASNLKKAASQIQLEFDMDVFDLKWDDRFLGTKMDNNELVARKSKDYSKKKEKSLSNWYDLSGLKERQNKEIIRFCQKQNLQWNSTIRNRVNSGLNILVIASIIICFLTMLLLKADLAQVTNGIVNFVPLITWIITINRNYKRDTTTLNELCNLLSDKRYGKYTALLIEAKITEYRQNGSLIPDFIYRIYRKNDEETYKQAQIITTESSQRK
jgi:hypothetical protein